MKKYFLIISVFVILIILAIVLALNSKKKTQNVYKTVVFPNNPWKYQVINKSEKLDHNKWLQGYGTIGEGIDTLLKQADDTLVCITNFDIENFDSIKILELKIFYEANCLIYINNKLCCTKNYEDFNLQEIKVGYDSIKDLRNKYLNAINFKNTFTKNEAVILLKKDSNELIIKFYNSRISGKKIIPYVVLRTSITDKKNNKRKSSYKKFKSSCLPVIKISTDNNELPDSIAKIARMGVINALNKKNRINSPFNEYDGYIKIKTRGFTSLMFSKWSYNITTIGQDTNTKVNKPLLGMPAENDWVLYGSFVDKSLIRNTLLFDLSNQIGLYAPRTRYCELFINDEYQGIYILIERIKPDKNRVTISKLSPEDTTAQKITGGYILEIDRKIDFLSQISSRYNSYIQTRYGIYYPNIKTMPQIQKNYIQYFINEFENSLWNSKDIENDTSYLKYINLNTFIDYLLLQELSKNNDALKHSVFITKNRNGKLSMGPLWDFDLSFGLPNYYDGYHYENSILMQWDYTPFWWNKLMENKYFRTQLKQRWQELRKKQFSLINIYRTIDNQIKVIDPSINRNFEKWNILGAQTWPSYFNENNYDEHIDYLKFWIRERVKWLDNYYNKM